VLTHRVNWGLLRRRRQLGRVRLFLVTHSVIFASEPVAAEGALELAVAGVDDVVSLQIFAGGKTLRAFSALKLFLDHLTLSVGRRYCAASCHRVARNRRLLRRVCGVRLAMLHET
jgi:hypothetical protein